MGVRGASFASFPFLWITMADLSSLDSCINRDARKAKKETTAISSGPWEPKSEHDSIFGNPPRRLMVSCMMAKFFLTRSASSSSFADLLAEVSL